MGLSSVQMMRMSRLLDEALALDEAGRRAWLASLGPEHQDIAEALREALSLGITGAEGELSTLPKVGADDAGATASGLQPGARVGPYELIKPLGAGGMAEVWLARRADGAFKREVALKLPMMTRLRKDLEERFARERDILASLEHTNIARLYDAGTDSNGLPYLSMEYVQGQPITDWCDAHKLTISDRLQLVLQVLDGVQYAHERHVIHRDLKPSNILVTESGHLGDRIRAGAAIGFWDCEALADRGGGPDAIDQRLWPGAHPGLCEPGVDSRRCGRCAQRHLFVGSAAI
jgi:serine/threonine protein kinase